MEATTPHGVAGEGTMRCVWLWGVAAAARRAPREDRASTRQQVHVGGTAAQEGPRTAGTGQSGGSAQAGVGLGWLAGGGVRSGTVVLTPKGFSLMR